mmetsp:Transcript_31001/g.52356  ORF Transcript_31001/g.52356 Transcript_31001/m.52356 type:complete len:211 (-) Transcript_31001:1067-1699(-)
MSSRTTTMSLRWITLMTSALWEAILHRLLQGEVYRPHSLSLPPPKRRNLHCLHRHLQPMHHRPMAFPVTHIFQRLHRLLLLQLLRLHKLPVPNQSHSHHPANLRLTGFQPKQLICPQWLQIWGKTQKELTTTLRCSTFLTKLSPSSSGTCQLSPALDLFLSLLLGLHPAVRSPLVCHNSMQALPVPQHGRVHDTLHKAHHIQLHRCSRAL